MPLIAQTLLHACSCTCLGHRPESVHGEAPWPPGPPQHPALHVPAAEGPEILPQPQDPAQRPQAPEPAHQRQRGAQAGRLR